MNVGSIVFEPATVFMKQVDHSIFFTAPPLAPAQTESPMQLYCYIKQLDDVRAFMRRLDISKHVFPLRDAPEVERLCLHGQVFVFLTDHHDIVPNAMGLMAADEGMHMMGIQVQK